MDNSWVTQVEGIVSDYIEASLDDSNILVTTESYTGDTARFPAVYVHEMTQQEIGSDLDGSFINGVRSTFQLDIFANNEKDCKELSSNVMLIMKELRFKVIASPLYTPENGYHRSFSRYRRDIGASDLELFNDNEQGD